MKLGDSPQKVTVPVHVLGQPLGMDKTERNFLFQARVVVSDAIVFEGVCQTIGIENPNDEIDVAEGGVLTNCKFIKAKTGDLKGQYAFLVKKDFKPDFTGLGPKKWSDTIQ